jgi:hypothetical protein
MAGCGWQRYKRMSIYISNGTNPDQVTNARRPVVRDHPRYWGDDAQNETRQRGGSKENDRVKRGKQGGGRLWTGHQSRPYPDLFAGGRGYDGVFLHGMGPRKHVQKVSKFTGKNIER